MKMYPDNHSVKCDNDDEIKVIDNGCDGVERPIAKHCYRNMLVRSMGILSKSSMSGNKINLANPRDLLSTMRSNGKYNVKTLSQMFNTYKHSTFHNYDN